MRSVCAYVSKYYKSVFTYTCVVVYYCRRHGFRDLNYIANFACLYWLPLYLFRYIEIFVLLYISRSTSPQ